MGLISAGEVGHDIKIANDFQWLNTSEGRFSASNILTRTMSEVVAMDGARTPGPTSSQKNFRILYLLLTANSLSLGEWSAADKDVYQFAFDGDNGSSLYNFWEATGGRASVTMDGLLDTELEGTPVAIESIAVTGEGPERVQVTVASLTGATYTLLYSPDLKVWHSLPGVPGDGNDLVLFHDGAMFYVVMGFGLPPAASMGGVGGASEEPPHSCQGCFDLSQGRMTSPLLVHDRGKGKPRITLTE